MKPNRTLFKDILLGPGLFALFIVICLAILISTGRL